MKNKYSYLLLFLSLATFSCSDEIEDLQPFINANPDTFFNSIQEFENGLDGIYSQLYNYYADSANGLQGIPDIMSDNVVMATTGRRSNETYYDFRYNPNTAGAIPLYWSEAYEAINVANLIIAQIDNLPEGPARDNILGQALAARAVAHFDLARLFAKIPTQSEDANSSPGIIYMKVEDGDTANPFAEPARETVASNYVEIIGDLEAAAALIDDDNPEGRLDRDAVYAILSRVYLYNGDYEKAVLAANEVETEVATPEELPLVYTDATNAGVIWELSVNTSSESDFENVGVLYSQTSGSTTISEYVIDYEFYESLEETDVRKDVLQFIGTNAGNDYNAIRKFLGETGQVNGLVDIKIIRAAEVILTKAEALFELGREAEALETLNVLRDKRFTGYEGGETGDALLDAILYNRRVELAYEGHRFFDLKRRGLPVLRSAFGDIIDGSGTPAEVLVLPAGDFRFQLPIPTGEVNANSNLVQNPGY